MKKITFENTKWYKMFTPILPFKLGGKWYLWKKIRITYLICNDGKSIPIKTELVENIITLTVR
jgi:hypothetical protein